MRSTTLLHVRVPHALAEHVMARADLRGITVNAWLARMIALHAEGRLIETPKPEPEKLRA